MTLPQGWSYVAWRSNTPTSQPSSGCLDWRTRRGGYTHPGRYPTAGHPLPGDPEQRCWVHHARGSQFRLEDFEPFATPLILKVITELRLATTGGRSSDGELPFFNLEMGNEGIIVAVGWTGDWATTLRGTLWGSSSATGMKRTHLTLHPGEEIRTPRILLLFWEGERLHGHNLLRRFILAHHTPQPTVDRVKPITRRLGGVPEDTHLAREWTGARPPGRVLLDRCRLVRRRAAYPDSRFEQAPGQSRWATGTRT